MDGLIVTKLERGEHGEWDARVSVEGRTTPVTRRFGSWGTVPDREGRYQHLLTSVAVELQKRVRRLEGRRSGARSVILGSSERQTEEEVSDAQCL